MLGGEGKTIVIFLVFFLTFLPTACLASTLGIPVQIAPPDVDAIAIPVRLATVTDGVSGLYIKIFYDPDLLEAHVLTGADLNFTTFTNIDHINGTMHYATINYPDAVFNNDITVLYLQVKPKGVYGVKIPITLQAVTVFNATYQKVYPTIHNGSVLFVLNGDINNDGTVNFKDVMYLFNHLRTPNKYPIKYPSAAEVNGDGDIDQQDVIYLVHHIFGTKGYEQLK